MDLKRSIATTIRPRLITFCTLAILLGCTCVGTPSSDSKVNFNDPERIALIKDFKLDSDLYTSVITTFTAAPHPFGSPRQRFIADYLVTTLKSINPHGETKRQEFSAETPNPRALNTRGLPVPLTQTRTGWNIIHRFRLAANPSCAILLGSHYDTKIVEGMDYVGANDSGSSSVLLIGMIQWMNQIKIKLGVGSDSWNCDLYFVWFDGEESILPGWFDGQLAHPAKIQDNTYGSRHFVSKLKKCARDNLCLPSEMGGLPLRAVIIADMVGHPNLKFTYDTHSTSALREMFNSSAKYLGYQAHLTRNPREIEDDHLPFVRAGIPAMVAIDFENIESWHAAGDYPENLSTKSITTTGRIISNLAFSLAAPAKVKFD